VGAEDLATWFKIYFGAECSYLAVGAVVKISLTVFIMRLFPTQFIRIAGISTVAFIGAFTISMTLALTLKCRPARASWDKSITDAKCWSSQTNFAVLLTQGILMFVLDVFILALSIWPIWRLQMPKNKRLLILGLFAIGSSLPYYHCSDLHSHSISRLHRLHRSPRPIQYPRLRKG
jgi:hypothetical protein